MAQLKGSIHSDSDVTLVTLSGELDASTQVDLRRLLTEALDRGDRSVRVLLDEVSFMDSSTITEMLLAARSASTARVDFAIRDPQPPVRRMLELTGVDGHLGLVDRSPDDLIAS